MTAQKRQASDPIVDDRSPKHLRLTPKTTRSRKRAVPSGTSAWDLWKDGLSRIMDAATQTVVEAILIMYNLPYYPGDETDDSTVDPSSPQESSPDLTASSSPPQTPVDDTSYALGVIGIRDGSSPNRRDIGERLLMDNLPTPPPEPLVLTSTPRFSKTKSTRSLPENDTSFAPESSTPKTMALTLPDVSPERPNDLATIPSSSRTSFNADTTRSSTSISLQSTQSLSSRPSTSQLRSQASSFVFSGQALPKRKRALTAMKRKHIHDKAHKAAARSRIVALKKEYQERVRQGEFSSSFEDYQSWVEYGKHLKERLGDSAKRVSKALDVGLITGTPSDKIFPEIVEKTEELLGNVLARAHATLRSPAPPKAWTPLTDQLKLQHRAKDNEIEARLRPPQKPLPQNLAPEDDLIVANTLRKRGVVSKFERESVNDQDIRRLTPGTWLNDEIINFYGALIMARCEAAVKSGKSVGGLCEKPLKVHYFNSFFWGKLLDQGYEKARLSKWTKKVDLFAKDIVLIPVNHANAHWTAAAINFRQKRIESYDSMGMRNNVVFQKLREYLDAEHKDKKKKPFDFSGWVDVCPKAPLQENGYDCGVFTCQFLESLSRGVEVFTFEQKNMPYLRRRMIWEIAQAKLWGDY